MRTKAIDQGRWADAVKIFTEVAEPARRARRWRHSTGRPMRRTSWAQAKPAQAACAELRKDYPKSRWIEDCGALEVEIQARTGKPVRD